MFGMKTTLQFEEDEILAKAEEIKARRAHEERVSAFLGAEAVRIQWGNLRSRKHRLIDDESFAGNVETIWVKPEDVKELVLKKIGTDAEIEPRPKSD